MVSAAAGVPPGPQLGATSLLLGAALLGTARQLPDEPHPHARGAARVTGRRMAARVGGRRTTGLAAGWIGPAWARLRRRFPAQLVVLAVVAFLAAVTEGTARQWCALYTSDVLHAGRALGAATFTGLATADAVARLGGDRIVDRFGARRFLTLSMAASAIGLGCALIAGTAVAALLGFAMLGLGMGCAVPTVIGLAGRQPGLTVGESVSAVMVGQWPAFLVGPPLIGLLAGAVGLRAALVTLVVTALLAALLVRRAAAEPEVRAAECVG